MRVLQVVADGSPGGGTTHVLQILRGLGSTYSLGLVTQTNSFLFNEARGLGIPCYAVDFFRSRFSRFDPRVALQLRRGILKFGPQVVHAHGGRAGFFNALTATQVPVVYTVHGYWLPYMSPVPRWFAVNAERLATRRAQRVIFVSNDDAKVAQLYKLLSSSGKSSVIHNGIRLTGIPVARPTSPKHIGFVGRLHYQKDPLLFLDVAERLPGYTATIVGDGELEGEVRAEIERRRNLSQVRMLGPLPHSETLRVISNISALVMTSRWETFGYVAAEAMQSGVPVVGTRVGGLAEVVESDDYGLLIEGRSADNLAAAVVRVTEDSALRDRIIRNARSRVRTLFSEERMLREISGVYRRVAP